MVGTLAQLAVITLHALTDNSLALHVYVNDVRDHCGPVIISHSLVMLVRAVCFARLYRRLFLFPPAVHSWPRFPTRRVLCLALETVGRAMAWQFGYCRWHSLAYSGHRCLRANIHLNLSQGE